MLAYIKGTLEMKMTGYIVIDVGGLGYKVFMSESGIEKLGNIGETVKVHTFYKVREDDISIFGFNTFCKALFNSRVPNGPFLVGVNTCMFLKKS